MKTSHIVIPFLLAAGTAAAQFTITDVVNAGSHIASAASSGGAVSEAGIKKA